MPEIPAVKNWLDFVNHRYCFYFLFLLVVGFFFSIKGGTREKAKPVKSNINQSFSFLFIIIQLGIADITAPAKFEGTSGSGCLDFLTELVMG